MFKDVLKAFSQSLKSVAKFPKRQASVGEKVMGRLMPYRASGSMGIWGQDRFEQVAHFKNWTYVAVNAIATKISQHMPNVAILHDKEIRGVTKRHTKALGVVSGEHNLMPVGEDHRLKKLFRKPNPTSSYFDWLYESQVFLELCGVNYNWIIPDSLGLPSEMWVIPAHWVWPKTSNGDIVGVDAEDNEKLIAYYEVRPWGGFGQSGYLRFPPDEIVMEKWPSPLSKIDGYSALTAIAQWIDSEESISKSRWSQFINVARPEFWIQLGEGMEDPDQQERSRLEAAILEKYSGEKNYGKPIIGPPGATITPLSFSPTEMAYFQCLDEETECLTSNGWKKYNELTLDDEIACFDPNTKTIQYDKPSKITIEPYYGKMYRWKGKRFDALMSPNHRTYTSINLQDNWKITKVKDLDDVVTYKVMIVDKDNETLGESVLKLTNRSTEEYKGNIWCVTVPTGLFVVRRNGKAHITGNSEEQIRDMILSAFQVPKTIVGISSGMTQGSVVGTLQEFCTFCINPRLTMRGLALTNTIGEIWSKKINKQVMIWWDDHTPVDPQQRNADIQTRSQTYSITPNEVREIFGDEPYKNGGDDPLVSGPGGIVPLPLNTGDDWTDLGSLVPTLGQDPNAEQGGMPGMPPGMDGQEAPGVGQENADDGSDMLGLADEFFKSRKKDASGPCKPGQNPGRDNCIPADNNGSGNTSDGKPKPVQTNFKVQSLADETGKIVIADKQLVKGIETTREKLTDDQKNFIMSKINEVASNTLKRIKSLPKTTQEIASDPKKQIQLARTVAGGLYSLGQMIVVGMPLQVVKDFVATTKTLARTGYLGTKLVSSAMGKAEWTKEDTKNLKKTLYDIPALAVTMTANYAIPSGPLFQILYKTPVVKDWFPSELTNPTSDPITNTLDVVDKFTAIPAKWISGSKDEEKEQEFMNEKQITFFLEMLKIMIPDLKKIAKKKAE